jgi:hypothetical protein
VLIYVLSPDGSIYIDGVLLQVWLPSGDVHTCKHVAAV